MTRFLTTPAAIVTGSLAAGPQPTLSTSDGLVLRPWQPDDVPVFLGAYQDPAVRQWHTRRPGSAEDVRQWFERYRADWARETGAHWAVTGRGEVLGRIALGSVNPDDGIAGCSYWVLPSARGAGVAPRALTALAGWALAEGRFHRLYLDHSTRNQASCRVATKAGFAAEGTKRSAAVHADGRHDMHLHARIRGDGPAAAQ